MFPEIDYDKAEFILGLDVIVWTTAKPMKKRAPC